MGYIQLFVTNLFYNLKKIILQSDLSLFIIVINNNIKLFSFLLFLKSKGNVP